MASVNKVTILGALGRDPEIRNTQNGTKIANLSVATSESWKDKNSGEWKEKTEWHKISVLDDRLSEVAEKYLKKGSKVYLEGQLQTRKWQGSDGVEKYTTEIVLSKFKGVLTLLDPRPTGQQTSGGGGETQPGPDEDEDSIPFITRWGYR